MKSAASEERACDSSWAVKAVMEGMECMEVMELKRESRRVRPCVERADIEELWR
jgi:hypothetical protein